MKKVEMVVVNKWTYLILVVPVYNIISIMYYSYQFINDDASVSVLISDLYIHILILIISIGLFIKFNMYSYWSNPDHPKNKAEYNKDKEIDA